MEAPRWEEGEKRRNSKDTKTQRARLRKTNRRTRQDLFTDEEKEGSNLSQGRQNKYLNMYLRIKYSVKADEPNSLQEASGEFAEGSAIGGSKKT